MLLRAFANAARVAKRRWACLATTEAKRKPNNPAALQRCKFDAPLLAAGSLIGQDLLSMRGNSSH